MSCFFGHNWDKWEQYLWEGTIRKANRYGGEPIEVTQERQRRKCKDCGKMQVEEIRY